jgi:hypothetical protein
MRKSGERLSFKEIASRWLKELPDSGIGAEDLALDLVTKALQGRFGTPLPPAKKDEERPCNVDPRFGHMTELSERCGEPVRVADLHIFLAEARRHGPESVGLRSIAQDVLLSLDGLRHWCNSPKFEDWADARGLERPNFLWEGKQPGQSGPATDPYRTGLQGRPTIKHLIEHEFERRAAAGETLPTLFAEARALRDWVIKEHPKAPLPTAKTITNNLRAAYRRAGAQKPA